MLILLLAYLGGVLTILSPCILPVLPFVFSRTGQRFTRSGLPLLAGMALTFALVATLASVGGAWVVSANQYGRWLALALLALFGLALLLPRLAERLAHPLVRAGDRLSQPGRDGREASVWASLLLGVATGLLWAPCAGPILGLVLTGAALQGANLGSTALLLAYALGAATSLAAALLLGGRVLAAMKRFLGAGEWLRRALGGAVLAGVVAIALGLDTGVLAQVSSSGSTNGLEQALVNRLARQHGVAQAGSQASGQANGQANAQANAQAGAAPAEQMAMQGGAGMRAAAAPAAALPVEGMMPSLDGAVQWLNSPPLTTQGLRGKVVLIDFWTYSCINCLRSLPYIKAWADRYRNQGLVVIGVHAPEFAFERDIGNVKRAVHKLGVDYPVAIDNNYAIWRAFNNEYWPAHYFVDAQGRIRYHHFGEGDYAKSEQVIQELLREAGAQGVPDSTSHVLGQGIERAADMGDVKSPETYLGYERARGFASGPAEHDLVASYDTPQLLGLNRWGLQGKWDIGGERATLVGATGRIVYRFHARDLHLVLGPGSDGKPVRFKVLLDGHAPGDAHGVDVAPDGTGVVTEQRLYQLLRQPGEVADHTFTIEFLDPGVSAYAFTFG
ncbi:cytochrome c biogenesis protein DipZ [Candidimonas humi]|uniref:Cytochrome c biogenesis protein DipZ n=1 Tax=Candidimonas humi TaxID=683355 RepID=A0ABV8NXY7_9BURK|nr:cytochrome c biogenesis protein DipZ [Candidimonas humi]MBV6305262.1 cytochrome c biogenesis protein DipZ [Candidimonas humi]